VRMDAEETQSGGLQREPFVESHKSVAI
jgi:hypothetical protein